MFHALLYYYGFDLYQIKIALDVNYAEKRIYVCQMHIIELDNFSLILISSFYIQGLNDFCWPFKKLFHINLSHHDYNEGHWNMLLQKSQFNHIN